MQNNGQIKKDNPINNIYFGNYNDFSNCIFFKIKLAISATCGYTIRRIYMVYINFNSLWDKNMQKLL